MQICKRANIDLPLRKFCAYTLSMHTNTFASGGSLRLISLAITVIALLALSACSSKSTSTITYDTTDATVRTFALTANDSFPGLALASFTVDNRIDTGLIAPANSDSLLFGTPLDSVIPKVTFTSRPAAAIYYIGDTSFIYTGSDTVNLTRQPVYLRVYSADRKHEKYYRIVAYAHQIDPDLYRVDTILTQLTPIPRASYTLYTNQTFYTFLSDGQSLAVTHSADAYTWTDETTVNGLPATADIRQIVVDSTTLQFAYIQDSTLYLSEEGSAWTATALHTQGWTIRATLMSFGQYLWVVAQKEDTTYLGYLNAESLQLTYLISDTSLPVSDFAAVVFTSNNGSRHALLQGGFDKNGKMLSACWSIEQAGQQFRIINIDTPNYPQSPIAGATIVAYNHRLIRFGGIQTDGSWYSICSSESEGLFYTPITANQLPLPATVSMRYRQSAIQVGEYIYLFGGQSHSQFHNDIYRCRLNSVDW